MKLRYLLLAVLLLLFIPSCISYQTDSGLHTSLTDFPLKPSLKDYSRKPIVEKKDNNFVVTDEYLENSILLKKYSDKIDSWKTDNSIK